MLATLGASQRRLIGGRRPTPAGPEPDPEPVTTSRVTLIAAQPLPSADEARRWLAAADGEAEAARALAVLNGMLRAHRVASADPHVREVGRDQLLVARVGFGEGEQVAEGRWTQALELPRPRDRPRRGAALRPQERLAALLGARDAALAAEELTLRARADLDAGDIRQAALQLRVALEAALAELQPWTAQGDIGARLEELRAERDVVGAAANAALQGGLDDAAAREVARVLGRLEAILRARTALGFE